MKFYFNKFIKGFETKVGGKCKQASLEHDKFETLIQMKESALLFATRFGEINLVYIK
jgi:hypothetical protein